MAVCDAIFRATYTHGRVSESHHDVRVPAKAKFTCLRQIGHGYSMCVIRVLFKNVSGFLVLIEIICIGS